jgi:hypothetical protein
LVSANYLPHHGVYAEFLTLNNGEKIKKVKNRIQDRDQRIEGDLTSFAVRELGFQSFLIEITRLEWQFLPNLYVWGTTPTDDSP